MKLHLKTLKRALPIPIRNQSLWLLLIGSLLVLSLAGCYQPMPNYDPWKVPQGSITAGLPADDASATPVLPSPTPLATITPAPTGPTPTPNQPAALPTLRSQETEYIVQAGDSLARIALLHQVSVAQILEANPEITDPNLIEPEQKLLIPPASANELAPDFKIIPDAELFYSPSAVGFDVQEIVAQFGGKLAGYHEELEDGTKLSGAEIVQKVAEDFSVNPRI
ncbi:MAG TPA: LysM domain-containing protein, partial [Anaerolineaceae bacterium]|nr:LysM domain-containing protein [Anaerolineaceae bacterium]